MIKTKKIFFLASALLTRIFCNAQEFNFESYNLDNGLSSSYVYDIGQDKFGKLYLATENGLVIYDGYNFKTCTTADSLSENITTSVCITAYDSIILGHFQEGVSKGYKEKFRKINFSDIKNVKITAIVPHISGHNFIATKGLGLFVISPSGQIEKINLVEDEIINDLCMFNTKYLAVASDDGIKLFEIEKNKLHVVKEYKNKFAGEKITAICTDNNNNIFACIESGDIIWIQKYEKGFRSRKFKKEFLKVTDGIYTDICVDNNKNIYLSVSGEGVRIISYEENINTHTDMAKIYSTGNGLPTNNIQKLFIDPENNLWMGTYGKGLIKLADQKFFTIKYKTEAGITADVLSTSKFNSQNFAGTADGIFKIFEQTSGQVKYISVNDSFKLPNKPVNFLLENKKTLYILSNQKEVYYVSSEKRVAQKIPLTFYNKSTVVNSLSAKEDLIYIATSEALYIFNSATKKITTLNTLSGLLHNNIKYAFHDSKNRVWIASPSSKISYIENDEVYTVDEVEGFKSFTLNHIAEDIKGNIWFASDGDGVFKFDNTNFTNFSTKNGLVSNYCYSVFIDSNYAVWVTHKNAVSRKQLSKTKFEKYNSPLDFSNREFSTHAFYVTDRTTISWGTSDGLLVYNSTYDKPSNFVPYCSINKIFFNDSAFYPTQSVNMPYGKYNVKFDFVGISYRNPESVIYKYKIEELDEEWTQLTYSTRSINYPSLSDGKYTFKLICANENGIWLDKPVSFTFYIQSPVWKKWWFYLIILVIISVLVYIYVKIKTQRYVQNQIKLHAIIDEQTFLLKKEKNAFESLSKELTVKNNDMLSSIRYAKRIQDAILPLEDEFKNEYLDVFIYYKPRDIVSGDFYYLRKKEDELIVGAVDCTGHGVPGALMSVVGYKILHKIVEEYKLSSPLEILNSLNANVSNFFYRNAIKSNTFDINDGMDVALCKVNLKKLQIQFSGAGRPLYIVRRGELREHSGSVFSIGKEKDFMPDAPYTQTEFDLLPNDMVYLFSDGFVDQFGGENNKRYTSKAFKKLFERIAPNDVKTQKELIEAEYQSWSAGRNQIDDILIIGLKIK